MRRQKRRRKKKEKNIFTCHRKHQVEGELVLRAHYYLNI